MFVVTTTPHMTKGATPIYWPEAARYLSMTADHGAAYSSDVLVQPTTFDAGAIFRGKSRFCAFRHWLCDRPGGVYAPWAAPLRVALFDTLTELYKPVDSLSECRADPDLARAYGDRLTTPPAHSRRGGSLGKGTGLYAPKGAADGLTPSTMEHASFTRCLVGPRGAADPFLRAW